MKNHLCCECGVMLEERRGRWGRVGRCLWSLNWHSQTSVVLYLSHPSDSNSYTLRCLYILTLGLQGHNLKRYPVKNVEKYKRKIDMFGGKANEGKGQNTRKRTQWNHSPKDSRSQTTEQKQMLRPCRIPSFALNQFKTHPFCKPICFLRLTHQIVLLETTAFIFFDPVAKGDTRVKRYGKAPGGNSCLSPYGATGEKPWRWEKQTHG